ncbi:methyltransferase [Tengunoibacter tsumagoiensis]|uniref:Methyltransferase n=1 Tax=Tengunoibacter tsumagoiensis TaxID=2014871 RepID=A0A402A9I6_9CHLR|nr:methyltransferase [Tengunoibacter tsumagoiensis]GCE15813.1 methyltransferase [Tengunoibacter tsumagoiensis]
MVTNEVAPIQQKNQAALSFFSILGGEWSARMVQVAAELNIADLLTDGPKTLSEIALSTQTHTPTLKRLLQALVAIGIFAEPEPDTFALTALSQYLCTQNPESLRSFTAFFGLDWTWAIWYQLGYAVKTGESAMRHVHGMNMWQYLETDPHAASLFNKGMAEFSTMVNPSLLEAYDFSAFHSVADIGGGTGNFLALLHEHYPAIQTTLLDRPSVIEAATAQYAGTPFGAHGTFIGGDFFTEIPENQDAYLFKFIANDWDDERVRQILTTCRKAIPAHGKILFAEFMLIPQQPAVTAALFDVANFLCFDGGHGRTAEEFRALFEEAGFTLQQVIPTTSGLSILEGTPR